jgi:hypothetical protein
MPLDPPAATYACILGPSCETRKGGKKKPPTAWEQPGASTLERFREEMRRELREDTDHDIRMGIFTCAAPEAQGGGRGGSPDLTGQPFPYGAYMGKVAVSVGVGLQEQHPEGPAPGVGGPSATP